MPQTRLPPRLNVHSVETAVQPAVKTNATTRKAVERLLPYLPADCVIIAGFLSRRDESWRVGFHWEAVVSTLAQVEETLKPAALQAETAAYASNMMHSLSDMRQSLEAVAPEPRVGYLDSTEVGLPVQTSASDARRMQRWQTVSKTKRDLTAIARQLELPNSADAQAKTLWALSLAPVNPPGTSKHLTGYALDVQCEVTPNRDIVKWSRQLGASYALDEVSHVHVEFAKGVRPRR